MSKIPPPIAHGRVVMSRRIIFINGMATAQETAANRPS